MALFTLLARLRHGSGLSLAHTNLKYTGHGFVIQNRFVWLICCKQPTWPYFSPEWCSGESI